MGKKTLGGGIYGVKFNDGTSLMRVTGFHDPDMESKAEVMQRLRKKAWLKDTVDAEKFVLRKWLDAIFAGTWVLMEKEDDNLDTHVSRLVILVSSVLESDYWIASMDDDSGEIDLNPMTKEEFDAEETRLCQSGELLLTA
jgi:hypothetical protein